MQRLKQHLLTRWQNAGWNEFVVLANVALVCLGIWLFLFLASAVAHESFQSVEENWMRALRDPSNLAEPRGPWWLAELGRDVSALGSAIAITLLSCFTVGFLALRHEWGRITLLVVSVAGGYALSNGLKAVYDRERPDVVPHLTEVSSASFPSGHSMSSSVVYLTMGALLAQTAPRRREKVFIIGAACFMAGLIGLSRIFLGVHYPSDVLAGWSAGTAWALVCWLVAERWWRTKNEPSSRRQQRA